MKRVLNKNKLFYFIMSFVIIVILIITGVKVYKDFFSGKKEDDVVTKNTLEALELYGYTLDDLDTDLYKEYFEELKNILNSEEVDYESYAKVIVKLFVTDFYTLDNKVTSTDIGGAEFIHPDLVSNFKMNAGDTMYHTVKTNINGDRQQDLPVVSKVEVNGVEKSTYAYNEKEYEAYKVSVTWEYEKDLGYESKGVFTVIKDSNKLYLVEK